MPTLVLKLGGAVVEDPATIATLAQELSEVRGAGVTTYLVHGAGPQLDAALRALREPVVKHKGLRVTSARAADVVQREMDAVGARLALALERAGVPARHIPSGKGLFEARVKVPDDGADLGRVGTVTEFHHLFVHPTSDADPLAVLTPVGLDPKGPLNVNADEGAAAVARALRADWLVLGTDVEHVLDAAGAPIARISRAEAVRLVASQAARGGMIPKLASALEALDGGTRTVLITKVAPGVVRGLVLERAARGTLVVPEAGP